MTSEITPKAGQDDDVDLRVAEDPEQVLPQDRHAARFRHVEQRAEGAVHDHLEQRDGERREREDDQEAGDQHHPGEHRHAHHRHAGRAHVDDGDDQVHGRHQRADAAHEQADHVEVGAQPRVVRQRRERRVRDPADVGRPAEEEAGVDEQPADEVDPVPEGVEPRERQVARADLQRHEVVREADAERHDGQEHHRHAVHREHLVVDVGAEEGVVGRRELQPDEEGLDAGQPMNMNS
jgi:hypothetical protein